VEERYRRSALDANGTEPSGDDIEAQLEYEELEMLIQHTLQRLPERRLRIFKMHRMEAKKYTEIATLLSISVKTVEAEMTKALRVLRAEVDNYIRGR
jgi:RNA polymerase sigma-70 factor (ECF subfamily)